VKLMKFCEIKMSENESKLLSLSFFQSKFSRSHVHSFRFFSIQIHPVAFKPTRSHKGLALLINQAYSHIHLTFPPSLTRFFLSPSATLRRLSATKLALSGVFFLHKIFIRFFYRCLRLTLLEWIHSTEMRIPFQDEPSGRGFCN
jgi:hypothetical protein